MVLDDRRQLPAVFFVWKSIDDSSEAGKDAAECERRWPVLGGWNCAKFPYLTVLNLPIVKDIHHNIVAGDIIDSDLLSALQ